MKKTNKKSLIIVGILLSLVLLIGFSYAYYNANVTIVSETQTIIRSKKLALIFNDTKEVNVADMIPGKSVEKTFNVENTGDDTVTYNIKVKDITSSYNEDLVYTLYRDNEIIAQQTPMPKTNPQEYLLTNIPIEKNTKHEYVLRIEFLYTDEYQGGDKVLEFAGTVEIDVEEIDKEIYQVPYKTNEISSTLPETSEELPTKEISNEFIVKSTSVSENQIYNVLLEDIENEYASGELTYSLEKNGVEISTGEVPQEGEIPYLTIGENLNAGSTDTYELTITENIDNTTAYVKEKYKFSLLSNELAQTKVLSKKFNAKVVIDQKDADITPPDIELEFKNKTTNSVTYNLSCKDNESGIKNYKIYKDGTLVDTRETEEKTIEYTFNKLNPKEYEFKLVCTNKMDVTSTLSQKVTPNGLISPTYNVSTGPAQSKNVEITFTGEGTYLFKTTGEVKSNIDVVDCGNVSEGAIFSCGENVVAKDTVLTSNTWYKATKNVTLIFTSNGSIVAKVADGTNYVSGEELIVEGIDRQAPSIPEIESEYSLGNWTNKEIILKLNSTDNTEVDYYEYKVSDGEWTKVSGNEIKFTEDMNELVSIRAIDTAENISEVKEVEVKIDTTKPNVVFGTNGSTTWSKSQSTKVSVSDIAGISELKYQWTQSTTAPAESTFTTTFTNDTTITKDTGTGNNWYLWIYAKDSAGNITITKSNVFYIDNTAPSTCTISGNPSAWATSATLKVTGADDNSGLNTNPYSWDGTNYSTTQTKNVTNGTYTAYVKDKAGNIKSCSATVSKVDTTAPSTPTLGTVSNYGKSLTVAFTAGVDTESGVTHACYYGTSSNPATAGTLSGTTCYFNNLSQGTTYYYKVCATNGAKTQTCSSVGNTTTYTGVAAGNYSVGGTVSYGGLSWYVLGDTGASKGSYLKLVQNGVTGKGTYNNANTYLNGTFLTDYSGINTDKARGGLVAQGSNYVTTDSGTTSYRPNNVYWNKSGYVVIPNAVTKYALSSFNYRVGGAAVGHSIVDDANGQYTYYGGVTSSTLYTAGQNVALSNGSSSITYSNGGYTTSTGNLSSTKSTDFKPSSSVATPSASTLPMAYSTNNVSWGGSKGVSTVNTEYTNKNTKTWVLRVCGPNDYKVQLSAVSATKFSYYNGQTGTNDSNHLYSTGYYYSFAGTATSTTSGSSPSYTRTYDYRAGANCASYTEYKLANTSAEVYYRPYILVKEAYAS